MRRLNWRRLGGGIAVGSGCAVVGVLLLAENKQSAVLLLADSREGR